MADYYCKYCGRRFTSVVTLTSNPCGKHPAGAYKGKHALYEGSAKSQYICKYCGNRYSSLITLTSNKCARHPEGSYKGYHSPAL